MNYQTDKTISSHPIKVLLIEDNSQYAEMVQAILKTNLNEQFEVIQEGTLAQGLTHLEKKRLDVILLDMNLPDSVGIATLQKTIGKAPDLPIVILTGYADENQAIQALHEGAQDYLIKGQNEVSILSKAIRYALERKRVHRALIESDARFRQMIEKNADPVIIIDDQLMIQFVNPAVTQLFGRKSDDLLGSVFGFPIPQNGDASEIEIITSKGNAIVAEMRVVRIQWENEQVYLASLRDITDHKRMLAELEQTRRQDLQMKDVFLSKVSHELRSPLSVVHQFTTILLDGISGGINNEQRENLEIILRNVEELRNMIDDLLQVTRAEINDVVAVDQSKTQKISVASECIQVDQLIFDTLNSLRTIADKNHVVLSSNVPKHLPLVHADPHRTKQVLNNLINNAIKFTPSNGTVHVQAKIYENDPVFICVTVADTGPGVPVEEQEKIFEYLYQLDSSIDDRRKGLGIGLYICREIVERHGGRIWVENRTRKGCRFHFTLPIFSLKELLMPILTPDAIKKGNIGMIIVEVISDEPCSLTSQKSKILAEVWKMLNLCILPDLDVVLPRLGKFDNGETFYIVACSLPKESNPLIRRIRAHLRQYKNINENGMNVAITSVPIDLVSSLEEQPYEVQLKEILLTIEKNINKSMSPRRSFHAQEKDIACR
ncbi:MAG: ATP-binding protein [Desulfobacteraceae bacterium]|jgi:signal transduction histidine kinase